MPKLLIDPLDWDRAPANRLLTWSLAGPVFASGDQPELTRVLDELAAAGLADFRRPCLRDFAEHNHTIPDAAASMWVVFPTSVGQTVGLLLAQSSELLQIMDLAANLAVSNREWGGVDMRRIVVELDSRDGGRGEIGDWSAWLRGRDRQDICALPRVADLAPVEKSEERIGA